MKRQKAENSYQINENNNSGKQQKRFNRILLKNLLAAKHLKTSKNNSLQLFKKNYFKSQECSKKSGKFLLYLMYQGKKKFKFFNRSC